ncbi:MAG: hypothetical protein JXB30_18325 [Anaerolineae bacterium]|nr:hypothetical protein [Anaerolineae bacterium]
MKHRHLIVLFVVMLAVLASMREAHADMAPPEPPAGGSLDAGEPSTYVQMVSEDVLMTIGDHGADVRATFNMLNQGEEEEILDVRFPVGYEWSYPSGETHSDWGLDIDSFVIHVDGEEIDFSVDRQPDEMNVWATWQIAFPPGQTITVEVSYRGLPSYDIDVSFPIYSYVLHTGAGWYDTIGEGTVTIRLPYEINEYNVLRGDWYPPQPDFYTIAGTDIIWYFTDLEPNGIDVSVAVMPPAIWQEWQSAEKAVEENPDSVSAHLQLARILRRTVSYARNNSCLENCELFDRSEQEYNLWLNVIPNEYVLQVIPNIMDFHLDYIEMLKWNPALNVDLFCPEVKRVVALATDDERALPLKEDASWCDQNFYPTATLYAPPGCEPQAGRCPPPTLTPTSTRRPTRTPGPTRTPTSMPTLTLMPTTAPSLATTPIPPSGSGLIVGTLAAIAAVVIAGAGVGVWAYRRKA